MNNEDAIYEATLDTYTESAIGLIESLENVAILRASYFTEASKAKEKETSDKIEADILKNIQESIGKIFGYTIQDIQSGSIPKKLVEQAATIKEIGKVIKASSKDGDISKIKISCPNVWTYYEFVEELVEEHIEKFTVDKSLNLFNRVTGTGRSIDNLIKNLNEMSAELRKGKAEAVKGMNKKANKLMHKNTAGSVANRIQKAIAPTIGVTQVADDVDTTESASYGYSGVDPTTMLVAGVTVLAVELTALAVNGLASVHRFFKTCPTTIKMEKTTVGEVYTRLKALAPDKFLVHIAKVSKQAADAVGSKASIMGFAESPEGTRGAVLYANKINKLIKAYSKFYVSLVDYYIKALRPVLH